MLLSLFKYVVCRATVADPLGCSVAKSRLLEAFGDSALIRNQSEFLV